MSYGEWLLWCWICKVGSHCINLRASKADYIDEANLRGTMPWWAKTRLLRLYIWHWDAIGELGVLMESAAHKRLAYEPNFDVG